MASCLRSYVLYCNISTNMGLIFTYTSAASAFRGLPSDPRSGLPVSNDWDTSWSAVYKSVPTTTETTLGWNQRYMRI